MQHLCARLCLQAAGPVPRPHGLLHVQQGESPQHLRRPSDHDSIKAERFGYGWDNFNKNVRTVTERNRTNPM